MALPVHPNISEPQFTDAELIYLKAKIDRLIFLLDLSATPADVKTAWLTLLPEMNLEQIDKLTGMLEQELQETLKAAKERTEDAELLLKLQNAKVRYDQKISAAQKKVMSELQKIETQLKEFAM